MGDGAMFPHTLSRFGLDALSFGKPTRRFWSDSVISRARGVAPETNLHPERLTWRITGFEAPSSSSKRCVRVLQVVPRPELGIALRIGVVVVDAEQERVDGLPWKTEGRDPHDGAVVLFGHGAIPFHGGLGR